VSATEPSGAPSRTALVAGAAAALAAAALLLARFPWIAGPPSWRWTYEANALWPRAAGTLGLFGILCVIAALWTRGSRAPYRREAASLALLVLLAITLDLAFVGLSPLGPPTLPLIHYAPWATGFFWSARAAHSLPELLANYPEVVASLTHHAKTHPPGLVTINALALELFRGSAGATGAILDGARWIGIPRGALRGRPEAETATLIAVGLAVVILSRLSLIPAYFFARRHWGIETARATALILAVVPSLLLFAGEFDGVYPLFVLCALLLVGRGRGWVALLAAGAIAGAACLFTFVATVFLALVAVTDFALSPDLRLRARALRLAALGAGFALPLVVFQIATDCSIPRVFLAAYTVQHEVLIPEQGRRWLTWVFWNLVDFFLFLGPAVAALFGSRAVGAIAGLRWRRAIPADRFAAAFVAFLAVLDLSGLIPAETSRVWMFLVGPVVAIAVGGAIPFGRRGLLLILALEFGLALVAKGSLLMIDVRPNG